MTLIELMVVIVILVTLVAGVLPLVSPNNDSRKIADAARGLQTYFMQAQAEAARIGRPVGVGFRETIAGSGVALEAFQMIVPKPYAGSTTQSTVDVAPVTTAPTTYGPVDKDTNPDGNKGTVFTIGVNFTGARLYAVHPRLALKSASQTRPTDDPLPPKMFRVGDKIMAGGHEFLIVDDERNLEFNLIPNDTASPRFLDPSQHVGDYLNKLICVRVDEVKMGAGASPLAVPVNGYSYDIKRQPLNRSGADQAIISSEPPYQLPAGVAIDLQASGREASSGFLYFDNRDPPIMGAVMFSPNGSVESAWIGGREWQDSSRVFLLVGRAENGGLVVPESGAAAWEINSSASDEDLRDVQARVNWLNPDSRWVMLDVATGRTKIVPNSQVDARKLDYGDDPDAVSIKAEQIEAAHDLAHHHDHATTGRGGTNN